MEATASVEREALRCGECGTMNPGHARFCKSCGSSILAPTTCPKCGADVPTGANFCSECGAKLVGARPELTVPAAPPPSAAPSSSSTDAETVRAEAKKLPPARPPSSNIGSNLLVFVAVLMALIVAIYLMNKDKPAEPGPGMGMAPPVQPTPAAAPSAPPTPAAPAAGAAAPSSAPFTGTIELAKALENVGQGTIYIIVRNQGMPNRGPPVAVARINSPTFPAEFTVGPGDVMMPNMPFAGPFDLYVRLDQDGNAMTKDAGDLVNEQPVSGVKPGDSGVKVLLDKRL